MNFSAKLQLYFDIRKSFSKKNHQSAISNQQ